MKMKYFKEMKIKTNLQDFIEEIKKLDINILLGIILTGMFVINYL